jgi:hypothetical protein
MHPLAEDYSNLKDAEIEARLQDLSKKYWMARNPDLKMQIANILNIYKEEISVRRAKAWEQQYQKRDKGLDNLIQIN